MTQKVTPTKIATQEKRAQALSLRKAGATYEQIGQHLGVTKQRAAQMVREAMDATIREPADNLRALEDQRLDDLLRGLYAQAVKGDLGAIDRILRIMERRAKLLGLDAPVRTEVSGPEGGPLHVFNHANVSSAIAARSGEYHLPPGEDEGG